MKNRNEMWKKMTENSKLRPTSRDQPLPNAQGSAIGGDN